MFAEVANTDGLLAWVMNAGSLGILGYHVIIGLPRMLESMLAAQKQEREAFEKRVDKVVDEMKLFRQTHGCRLPDNWQP